MFLRFEVPLELKRSTRSARDIGVVPQQRGCSRVVTGLCHDLHEIEQHSGVEGRERMGAMEVVCGGVQLLQVPEQEAGSVMRVGRVGRDARRSAERLPCDVERAGLFGDLAHLNEQIVLVRAPATCDLRYEMRGRVHVRGGEEAP